MADKNSRELSLNSRLLSQGCGLRDIGREGAVSSVDAGDNGSNCAEEEGRVYFVANNGRIKVGFSRNLETRLAALRLGAGRSLTLMGSVPGLPVHEWRAHGILRDYRIFGEWFRDCEQVRAQIYEFIRLGQIPLQVAERQEDDDWFSFACRKLYGDRAQRELHLQTGYDKRSCQRYVAGDNKPSASFLRALLRGPDGDLWLEEVLKGET